MARVHIVGAGISGLACAVRLARQGRAVSLYEAAAQAGGRCRSYFDAKLERSIDNGNHILLSANRAALSYLEEIGARGTLTGPEAAAFPFVDLKSGARWTVRPNAGPIPWWILAPSRRIPRTRPGSYLGGLRLALARPEDTVADCLDPGDPLWERFWAPLTVAALNTAPEEASARLLWLVVRETFGRGVAGCRPLIARNGLGASFVDPALRLLGEKGAEIRYNRRLRAIGFTEGRAVQLDFGGHTVGLTETDRLVIALPPAVAAAVVPGLAAPQDDRPIVNAHIRLPGPPKLPPGMSAELPLLGLVGGVAQWLLLRGDVVSLTVSAAEELAEEPSESVAARLWADTAAALDLDLGARPPLRVIKERRATFAQTPQALKRRAAARSAWRNLVLAGDWTDTGYPATIESAVRSGRTAARIVTES
ncbi:MAG: hydroxysqualene dehydroxylase HpnE [Kiloniellaceae bacterium]